VFEFTPEQKKAIMAILQQYFGNSNHSINHIKAKANQTKQVPVKANQQSKEDQGNQCILIRASRWIIDTGETNHVCHSTK
jgi:hypothetical protein